MEGAGLAIGGIALISTLKDCIDLISYIVAARDLGRDYEIFSAKLDIEKALLLQWAHRTNILEPYYDRRLDEPTIMTGLAQALSSIQLLLSDSQALRKRYGLQELNEEGISESVVSISQTRTSKLNSDFERLNIQIKRHRDSSCKLKIRWVIRDKTKFADLLTELAYFVSKLHELVPDTSSARQSMTLEDLASLDSTRSLRIVAEAAKARDHVIENVADDRLNKICKDRILERLWFRLMDDRRDSLPLPCLKTYEWALNVSGQQLEWDSLPDWLEKGSGLYWICGKPGSGKSTLMKYLFSADKSCSLLNKWAGKSELTVGSFFYYYLGTSEQRSQQGLARALLFQILNTDPTLIPDILPKMWRDGYGTDKRITLPSYAEMQVAFEKLGELQTMHRKYCFFVDGLDECLGKPMESIAFLQRLVENPNIKIIVSSRPIPACVQAFAMKPNLHLQNLTRGDIETYIHQSIGVHPHMKSIKNANLECALRLISDLTNKSCGVFLWVVLACHSLLEGFANYDNLYELQRRIDELPPQLEQLFQHMLDRIEERYQPAAAMYLRLCQQSHTTSNTEPLYTLGLAVFDDYNMDHRQIPNPLWISGAERRAKCTTMEGRIRSRCCGLVEVRRPSVRAETSCFCQDLSGPIAFACQVHDPLVDSTVEFMHRTVFDFLQTKAYEELIRRMNCEDSTFDAPLILSFLARELACLSGKVASQAGRHIKDLVLYGKQADSRNIDSKFKVITEAQFTTGFDHANNSFSVFRSEDSRVVADLRSSPSTLGLILAVEAGMLDLIRKFEVEKGRLARLELCLPLLYYAIQQPCLNCCMSYDCLPSSEMVSLYLLSDGCDPNELFADPLRRDRMTSPWKIVLQNACQGIGNWSIEAVKVFLDSGADLETGQATVEELCFRRTTDKALEISQLIAERLWASTRSNGKPKIRETKPSQRSSRHSLSWAPLRHKRARSLSLPGVSRQDKRNRM